MLNNIICTRNKKNNGISTCCYFIQLLIIVRYILFKYSNYNYISDAEFEKNIINIMLNNIKYNNKQIFDDQNNLKINEYLLNKIDENLFTNENFSRILHINKIYENQLKNISNKLKYMNNNELNVLYNNSFKYPIMMAFIHENIDSFITAVNHWFILYDGKILSACGYNNFYINYSEIPVSSIDFINFILSMNNNNKTNEDIFIQFFIKYFLNKQYSKNPINYDKGLQITINTFIKNKISNYDVLYINGYNNENIIITFKKCILGLKKLYIKTKSKSNKKTRKRSRS